MAIVTVSVRGDFAYAYDERNRCVATIPLAGGTLHGYTSGSISVRRGAFIYVHDTTGRCVNTIPA